MQRKISLLTLSLLLNCSVSAISTAEATNAERAAFLLARLAAQQAQNPLPAPVVPAPQINAPPQAPRVPAIQGAAPQPQAQTRNELLLARFKEQQLAKAIPQPAQTLDKDEKVASKVVSTNTVPAAVTSFNISPPPPPPPLSLYITDDAQRKPAARSLGDMFGENSQSVSLKSTSANSKLPLMPVFDKLPVKLSERFQQRDETAYSTVTFGTKVQDQHTSSAASSSSTPTWIPKNKTPNANAKTIIVRAVPSTGGSFLDQIKASSQAQLTKAPPQVEKINTTLSILKSDLKGVALRKTVQPAALRDDIKPKTLEELRIELQFLSLNKTAESMMRAQALKIEIAQLEETARNFQRRALAEAAKKAHTPTINAQTESQKQAQQALVKKIQAAPANEALDIEKRLDMASKDRTALLNEAERLREEKNKINLAIAQEAAKEEKEEKASSKPDNKASAPPPPPLNQSPALNVEARPSRDLLKSIQQSSPHILKKTKPAEEIIYIEKSYPHTGTGEISILFKSTDKAQEFENLMAQERQKAIEKARKEEDDYFELEHWNDSYLIEYYYTEAQDRARFTKREAEAIKMRDRDERELQERNAAALSAIASPRPNEKGKEKEPISHFVKQKNSATGVIVPVTQDPGTVKTNNFQDTGNLLEQIKMGSPLKKAGERILAEKVVNEKDSVINHLTSGIVSRRANMGIDEEEEEDIDWNED
jgi:hypothetical protein